MEETSWEKVGDWYDKVVGKEGHYYHQQVIIPKLLPLLALQKEDALIDFGCGNAFLCSHLPKGVFYEGIDASESLLKKAKSYYSAYTFRSADCTKELSFKKSFSHAAFILSLQNMEHPEKALLNAHKALQKGGLLALVLNHPCFRIPRQSSWDITDQKIMARKMQVYLSPLKIPIQMHPGKSQEVTFSFHRSLSFYSKILYEQGFWIEKIEEWCSDKTSTGKWAKMENRARKEFPLFLTLIARKKG